jgi:uncharacterized membrane protein YgcG
VDKHEQLGPAPTAYGIRQEMQPALELSIKEVEYKYLEKISGLPSGDSKKKNTLLTKQSGEILALQRGCENVVNKFYVAKMNEYREASDDLDRISEERKNLEQSKKSNDKKIAMFVGIGNLNSAILIKTMSLFNETSTHSKVKDKLNKSVKIKATSETINTPVASSSLVGVYANLIFQYNTASFGSYIDYLKRREECLSKTTSVDQMQKWSHQFDAEARLMGYNELPKSVDDTINYIRTMKVHEKIHEKLMDTLYDILTPIMAQESSTVIQAIADSDLYNTVLGTVDDMQYFYGPQETRSHGSGYNNNKRINGQAFQGEYSGYSGQHQRNDQQGRGRGRGGRNSGSGGRGGGQSGRGSTPSQRPAPPTNKLQQSVSQWHHVSGNSYCSKPGPYAYK